MIQAKNDAYQQPAFSLKLARTYLVASDPSVVERTWQAAIDRL